MRHPSLRAGQCLVVDERRLVERVDPQGVLGKGRRFFGCSSTPERSLQHHPFRRERHSLLSPLDPYPHNYQERTLDVYDEIKIVQYRSVNS